MRSPYESGNAVIFVLVAIVLFAGLGYTFMRSSQNASSNISKQKAKLSAQEIQNFIQTTGRGFEKLRQNGCSESDISFSNPLDLGILIAQNNSATAPVDKSCHVFDPGGANATFTISDWAKYQLTVDQITRLASSSETYQNGQIFLKRTTASNAGVGTIENDLMLHLNYVNPEICRAYNKLLDLNIDETIADTGPVSGDENTGYYGKNSYCRYSLTAGVVAYGQIRHVWIAR